MQKRRRLALSGAFGLRNLAGAAPRWVMPSLSLALALASPFVLEMGTGVGARLDAAVSFAVGIVPAALLAFCRFASQRGSGRTHEKAWAFASAGLAVVGACSVIGHIAGASHAPMTATGFYRFWSSGGVLVEDLALAVLGYRLFCLFGRAGLSRGSAEESGAQSVLAPISGLVPHRGGWAGAALALSSFVSGLAWALAVKLDVTRTLLGGGPIGHGAAFVVLFALLALVCCSLSSFSADAPSTGLPLPGIFMVLWSAGVLAASLAMRAVQAILADGASVLAFAAIEVSLAALVMVVCCGWFCAKREAAREAGCPQCASGSNDGADIAPDLGLLESARVIYAGLTEREQVTLANMRKASRRRNLRSGLVCNLQRCALICVARTRSWASRMPPVRQNSCVRVMATTRIAKMRKCNQIPVL